MNKKQKIEKRTTTQHRLREPLMWMLVVLLFAIGIVGNYWAIQRPLYFKLIGWLFVGLPMFFLVSRTVLGRKLIAFFREAQLELRKIAWPSRRETTQTTALVIVIVVIFSFMIWIVDMSLLWVIRYLSS